MPGFAERPVLCVLYMGSTVINPSSKLNHTFTEMLHNIFIKKKFYLILLEN